MIKHQKRNQRLLSWMFCVITTTTSIVTMTVTIAITV